MGGGKMYQLRKYNDFNKDILGSIPKQSVFNNEYFLVLLHALHSTGPATEEQVVKWIRENVPYIEKEYFIFEEDRYLPDGTEVGKKGESHLESHVSFFLDRWAYGKQENVYDKDCPLYPRPIISYESVDVNPPREKYKRGIYEVWGPNGVYVGQSKHVSKRWETHLRDIKNGQRKKIGKYFKPEEVEDLEFKIAFECSKYRNMDKYEMLHAQKLKTMGHNVVNEGNWNLL